MDDAVRRFDVGGHDVVEPRAQRADVDDHVELGRAVGELRRAVVHLAGAVGELGPVLAMALLLSGRSFSLSALILVAFVVLTLAFLAEAVEEIEDEGLRDGIVERLEGWLVRRRG